MGWCAGEWAGGWAGEWVDECGMSLYLPFESCEKVLQFDSWRLTGLSPQGVASLFLTTNFASSAFLSAASNAFTPCLSFISNCKLSKHIHP